MGGFEDYDRPEQGKAPDVTAVVDVGGRTGSSVEGPVEARKAGGYVVQRGGIGDAGAGWEVSGATGDDVWVEGPCLTLMLTDYDPDTSD